MRGTGYDILLNSPDELATTVEENLVSACPECAVLIHFRNRIQVDNLSSLLLEAEDKLQQYEQIYPYIKEICSDQKINPAWYQALESVLNWALSKGRGDRKVLSRDIKDAWLTYIALLSCSMIDKGGELNRKMRKGLRLNYDRIRLLKLTGNN